MVIAADACSHGVGAVISHIFADKSEKGIMHAARSLMLTEHNCSQVEKKVLALIFAVKKFHKMLFRCHFTLLTDHKPLLSIFGSKREFQCTLLVDYNARQSSYWDMISTYSTQDYRIWSGWCLVTPHQFAINPRQWHHHQHRGLFSACTHWLYLNNSYNKSGD